MADKKTIVVIGATGAQGGGLARAILRDKDGPFAVRAVTRDTGSDKARALAEAGAQVVAADLDDPRSLDSAFAGAYGAYCVTFFWAHFSPERELAEAKALADAASRRRIAAGHLVDARRRAQTHPPGRRPDADAAGQIQGAALRRQGRSRCLLHERGRAGHLPARVVLLGEFRLLRIGPKRAADGTLSSCSPSASSHGRHCRRRHRQVRVRHLQAAAASSPDGTSALPAAT